MRSFKAIFIDQNASYAGLLARGLHYYGLEMHWLRVDDISSYVDIFGIETWDAVIAKYPLECISAAEVLKLLRDKELRLPFIVVGEDIPEEDMVQLAREGVQAIVTHGRCAWLKAVIERELERARESRIHCEIQERLQRAEETLALAMSIHPMGSWKWNMVVNQVTWTPQDAFPASQSSEGSGISYERFLAMVHREDRLPVAHAIQRALEDGQDQSLVAFEFRCETTSGALRWLCFQGRVSRFPTGRPLCLKGIWMDCTDNKMAARERDTLRTQMRTAVLMIKRLMGLLTVCPHCQRIRDKEGRWHPLAGYLDRQPQIPQSHGLCPECASTLYPEIFR